MSNQSDIKQLLQELQDRIDILSVNLHLTHEKLEKFQGSRSELAKITKETTQLLDEKTAVTRTLSDMHKVLDGHPLTHDSFAEIIAKKQQQLDKMRAREPALFGSKPAPTDAETPQSNDNDDSLFQKR